MINHIYFSIVKIRIAYYFCIICINLTCLSKLNFIYVDITFQNVPEQFIHIFLIHGIQSTNTYVPLALFLFLDKSTSSYKNAFDFF